VAVILSELVAEGIVVVVVVAAEEGGEGESSR